MFIKTITKTDKKTRKQYNYYRLCESYRIGDKIRHRTIVSMGKLEGVENKEDRKLLADLIELNIKGEQRLPLFEVKPEIDKYVMEFSNRIRNEKLLDVPVVPSIEEPEPPQPSDYHTIDVNSIKHEEVREIGAEWLCYQALEQLSVKDLLLNTCGFNEKSANHALMHIISRAVFPASENKTAQWIRQNSGVSGLFEIPMPQINRHKLYLASNNLYKQKEVLEKHLSQKTNELFDLHDKIIFYDLTNTYFEGRKSDSKICKFGRSKEKRTDAKIVALAAVINAEGFLKYSRIYQGNISDSKTLNTTIDELSKYTSFTDRKPIVVMDAGIMTNKNALELKEKGYDYICVSRTKLKDYALVNPDKKEVVVHDKKQNPINLKFVKKQECEDTYMYVRSQQKAKKESSMNEKFTQRYQQELDKINDSLTKKGGVKKLEKVWERIGRLKEKYPTANKHYNITVVADSKKEKATKVKWEINEVKPKDGEGVYFIRTSLSGKEESTLWSIYNTLTEIEATFRVLKTDLSLRPVYHKNDENIEAHLFLGLLAYQVVATIRYQLKEKNITYDWRNIVRIMNSQKEVITILKNKNKKSIKLKKCSTPNMDAKHIYDALKYRHNPYFLKKSVVPE